MKFIHSAFFVYTLFSIITAENISSQTLFENGSSIFSMKNLEKIQSEKNKLLPDSTKKNSTDKVNFRMKKSPWKAVAYSGLLPGAGQFYNESYWKIPVIAGLGGYFVYELIKNNNSYLDYKQQYINSQTPQNPSGNLQLQSLREFYRDQRDNFIIYSIILYVVNLIDAYVDAQLFDFNVSDKINFGSFQKSTIINLRYSF